MWGMDWFPAPPPPHAIAFLLLQKSVKQAGQTIYLHIPDILGGNWENYQYGVSRSLGS